MRKTKIARTPEWTIEFNEESNSWYAVSDTGIIVWADAKEKLEKWLDLKGDA